MSEGPPKGNLNAKTHGVYSKTLTPTDKQAFSDANLEALDDEIRLNAVLEHRRFELTNDKHHWKLGLELSGAALSRGGKLKRARQDMQKAKDSDDNKPLPWED